MDETFSITLEKTGPMQFTTSFDKDFPKLLFDEPHEIGGMDLFPNAPRILTAAVANCLSVTFTFCSKRLRIPIKELKSEATCVVEDGRVKNIDVCIYPLWDPSVPEQKKIRCIKIYRKYCVVSKSVSEGIIVKSTVKLD